MPQPLLQPECVREHGSLILLTRDVSCQRLSQCLLVDVPKFREAKVCCKARFPLGSLAFAFSLIKKLLEVSGRIRLASLSDERRERMLHRPACEKPVAALLHLL